MAGKVIWKGKGNPPRAARKMTCVNPRKEDPKLDCSSGTHATTQPSNLCCWTTSHMQREAMALPAPHSTCQTHGQPPALLGWLSQEDCRHGRAVEHPDCSARPSQQGTSKPSPNPPSMDPCIVVLQSKARFAPASTPRCKGRKAFGF